MSRAIDLTGKCFGRLVVIRQAGHKRKELAWECLCDCGEKCVSCGYDLRSGKKTDCGNHRKEKLSASNKKHGLYGSKIHSTYYNMKNRCYNPKYYLFEHYGGKGITVCEEWLGEHGLENFYQWSIENGYQENLSIDRIDNSNGYSPENCRWVTMKTQQNNRTNNRLITINGQTKTMKQWADYYGASYSAIQSKIYKGVPDVQAVLEVVG